MWVTNGVHVVDRLTWLMASQAVSVSASIGTRAHYQAADDTATALIRYKNGLAGVAVSIGFADGAPIFDTQVICANGTLRIGGGRQPFLQLGQGNECRISPMTTRRPSCTMSGNRLSSRSNRTSSRPPPASGAVTSWRSSSRPKVRPSAGATSSSKAASRGHTQRSGTPVTRDHGWI